MVQYPKEHCTNEISIFAQDMLKNINKSEPIFFYVILALWLVPIWSVDYFVTGDGPCHLYNSKILLDWSHSDAHAFYKPFYYLNTNFEPNWLFNLLTAPLLGIFGSDWAEKIFFTIYVLGFGLGFRYFVAQINPAAKFISSIGLLFIYHRLLMAGFLNNSLSIPLWFWTVGYWWANRDDFRTATLLKIAGLMLLMYSAHPMGFTYAGIMMFAMLLGLLGIEGARDGFRSSFGLFYARTSSLALSALPSLILFAEFIFRRDWSSEKSEFDLRGTLENIARLTSLRTMNSTERDLATATAIVCAVLLLGALFLRLKTRKWQTADGLFLFVLLVVYTVVRPPSSISGGLEVPLRIGIILYPALLFSMATASFPAWAKLSTQLAALVLTIGFLAARLPIHRNASDYASEIRSCAPYIADRSTLLTLNYDWTGHTPQGKQINNGIWLFTHVDCYLGIDRSVVISDNYETHYAYFPVIARWNTDMYQQTDKDGINFDHRPPRADMLDYNRRTQQNLDYVLMVGYNDTYKAHPYTQEIFAQLEKGYNRVFTSEWGRAVLYRKK